MAKFCIHFKARDRTDNDDVGIGLLSLAKTREAALVALRELWAENMHVDSGTPVDAAIITDESGRQLVAIPAKEKPSLWASVAAFS